MSGPKQCAVYCRVSSDERLGQEFNSIDAQKDAGLAFIASQAAEGWVAVADSYIDPGYSGGNLDRPALKRLMTDIEDGKVDTVVIYKIDRLTRSLVDFSKLVEVFERHDVSFVSVTQQFNTTTSMGRLMLNVLLSFAQFEREVAGERIRDKIAASKRKGLWMGGIPPYGYDVVERVLVINESEAAVVRRIFNESAQGVPPTELLRALNSEGVRSKSWVTQSGRQRVGGLLDKKAIHRILRNRVYLGEISHRGAWYQGQHQAIISEALWTEVEKVLKTDGRIRAAAAKNRNKTDALLRGLLYAPSGEKMYPTYSRKKGKVYTYYFSKSENRFGGSAKTTHRIAATEIEPVVLTQIEGMLTSPEAIEAVVRQLPAIDEAKAVIALQAASEVWGHLFPAERHRLVHLLIERIDLEDAGLRIRWHPVGWRELLDEFDPDRIGEEMVELEESA